MAGIEVEVLPDRLSAGGREIFVLSSFWMAERLAPPPMTLHALVQNHPKATLTFDFEWRERPEALLNSMRAKLGRAESVGARDTEFAAPSTDEAREFIGRWHIQGFSAGTWYGGLRDASGWRAMCAVAQRKDGSRMLTRVAFKDHVAGGLSKLVKGTLAHIGQPGTLVTYADTRLSGGGGYAQAGFQPTGSTVPSFHLVNATGLFHWNTFTKTALVKKADFFDATWPLWRLLRTNGLWRIDDVPQRRFVLAA